MKALSELVKFVGNDVPFVEQVVSSVEWVASKSEGFETLEEAFLLHNKPLTVIVDLSIYNIGYGDASGNHVVFANPLVNEHLYLHGQGGERIHNSLDRFFCHEFKHASQPDLLTNSHGYVTRRSEIVAESTPVIPYERYISQITSAGNKDSKLRMVFGDIYDTHLRPYVHQITKEMLLKLGEDQIVREFVNSYEVPAIEFENFMMKKYKNEPARSLDYINSAIYDELLKSTDRNGFIESAIVGYRSHVSR